jgi:hypothetical protein
VGAEQSLSVKTELKRMISKKDKIETLMHEK